MSNNALIVFLKNPDSENVKTRLAKEIGKTKAREVYEKLLQHTLKESFKSDATIHLFFSGGIPDRLKFPNTLMVHQRGESLGDRMKNAFQDIFKSGFQNAVIIGSDCPELFVLHLHEAFLALHEVDVVIGPAIDGGYYLLGMKSLHPSIFKNKQWSTATVLDDTIEDLRSLGLSYKLLPTLTDVDTIEDYLKFPDFHVS